MKNHPYPTTFVQPKNGTCALSKMAFSSLRLRQNLKLARLSETTLTLDFGQIFYSNQKPVFQLELFVTRQKRSAMATKVVAWQIASWQVTVSKATLPYICFVQSPINNRTEEAMGSALDLWTAFRQGAFNESNQPFLGYFFMLEDVVTHHNVLSR